MTCDVQVDTWFKPLSSEMTDEEVTSRGAVIDRVLCLRPVLFDIFADHTVDPSELNFVEMVTCHNDYFNTVSLHMARCIRLQLVL